MSLSPATFAPAAFRALNDSTVAAHAPVLAPRADGARVTRSACSFSTEAGALQEVLVPLDGSAVAEHALPWAIEIAAKAGARLRLLHIHLETQLRSRRRPPRKYQEFDQLVRAPMEEYLAELALKIMRSTSVSIIPSVVDGRQAPQTLSDLVASGVDLVVMATPGRTALARMIRRSALDAVIQATSVPLLHVRGRPRAVDLHTPPSLHHTMVALDELPQSPKILSALAAIGDAAHGVYTLLHVIPPDGAFENAGIQNSDTALASLRESPVGALSGLARSWRRRLPSVRSNVVWSDTTVAKEILIQAEEMQADIIAVVPQRRCSIRRGLRRGVFDYLVRHSRIPVLALGELPPC